jgi:hypothetical protein
VSNGRQLKSFSTLVKLGLFLSKNRKYLCPNVQTAEEKLQLKRLRNNFRVVLQKLLDLTRQKCGVYKSEGAVV